MFGSICWLPLRFSCRVCRFMCCTLHLHCRLGGGHPVLRSPSASQKCPKHPSPSPGEFMQVLDPANLGLLPCCFPGQCLHTEESFDSGLWPWPHGADILPPALRRSLMQALVLLPTLLLCKERSQSGFPVSLSLTY